MHLEDSLLEHLTSEPWHAGIDVSAAHVTLHGTTIRNMQIGIHVNDGGIVDLANFPTYFPADGPAEVTIEGSSGTNFYGLLIRGRSSVLGTKLRLTNPGLAWGGDTGGAFVVDGSTLSAGGNLEISGSLGQGVFVAANSTLSLAGSHVTGGQHGGLVTVNHSTIAVETGPSPSEVSGNATDLFCDSWSLITGQGNVADATTVRRSHLLPGSYESIP